MTTNNLPVLVSRYLKARCVSDEYASNLRRLAKRVGSLTVPAVNRYLQKRLSSCETVTVATERAIISGIWRWAFDCELVDAMPRGLVKIKIRRKPTKAWTLEQCCTVVKGTFGLKKPVRGKGVSIGTFLRAWLLLGYETGARQGDLWEMRGSDLDGNSIRWCQHKTGDPHTRHLTAACVEAVNAMLEKSPDGRILGWVMRRSSGRRMLKAYLATLGMSGTSKWLRRSGATHIEREHPGKGRLHLGHRTVGLAEKAYIDWAQISRDTPGVPTLLK